MTLANDAPSPQRSGLIAAGDIAELLLQFDLNQQGMDDTVLLLKGKGGDLYATAEDLKRWRLRQPEVTPLTHNNEPFYPLKAITGLSYQLDETRLTVTVTAPAQAFLPNTFDETNKPATLVVKPGLGGFLNYDLLAEHATGQTRSSGLFEAGVFNGFGVGVASFVANSGSTGFNTETILKNIRVLAIDQTIQEDEEGKKTRVGQTATLELTPKQAEIITVAQQMADRLTLALRAVADTQEKNVSEADYLVSGNGRKGTVRLIKSGEVSEVGARK